MSAKPRFKPRVGFAETVKHDGYSGWYAQPCKDWGDQSKTTLHRVRVTDASDLTPEKAVEKVLQSLIPQIGCDSDVIWNLNHAAESAGMTASVVNGKVRVRRAKQ